MRCPFLKDEEVRFCEISPVRKMISTKAASPEGEKCSSRSWGSCPLVEGRLPGDAEATRCPYLRAALVQSCSAADVACRIPYSEALLSRCEGEGHRYCDLFIARAHPGAGGARETDMSENSSGITLPPHLACSANHMWLDVDVEGGCHVGVDAFFAQVVGRVDAVTIPISRGECRPAAVFTIGETDLTLVFPNRLFVTGLNSAIRSHPGKVTSDPYGGGWLFEGRPVMDPAVPEDEWTGRGLLRAEACGAWMSGEVGRLAEYAGILAEAGFPGVGPVMTDGGTITRGLARLLDREGLLHLHNTFFTVGRGRWNR